MPTSNKVLFDRFLSRINDRDICKLLTEEEFIELLDMRKNHSLSVYFINIETDAEDVLAPEFYREEKVGDNIETNFTISQWSSGQLEISTNPYATVDGELQILDTDYTFDENTLTFSFIIAPSLGTEVETGYNFIGEFVNELTDEEIWITTSGMLLSWLNDKVYNLDNMKNRMSPKDFKVFSPANLLDKMTNLLERTRRDVRRESVGYSYGKPSEFKGYT
jgi:hypothetical protein